VTNAGQAIPARTIVNWNNRNPNKERGATKAVSLGALRSLRMLGLEVATDARDANDDRYHDDQQYHKQY
jgi:hypothetical protein